MYGLSSVSWAQAERSRSGLQILQTSDAEERVHQITLLLGQPRSV